MTKENSKEFIIVLRNCDTETVELKHNSIKDFLEIIDRLEDEIFVDIPMLDDELICTKINGVKVEVDFKIVNDLYDYLKS